MSLDDLHSGGLYVVLFVRSDPPVADDFHWGLYLHYDTHRGGMKYHIKNIVETGTWIPEHAISTGVFRSFLLVGVFQIALVPPGWEDYVDQQLRAYDYSLNTLPGITCRRWLLWVLDRLRQPVNNYRVLNCDDMGELNEEIKEWGNNHAGSAARNVQPRPIGYSRFLAARR